MAKDSFNNLDYTKILLAMHKGKKKPEEIAEFVKPKDENYKKNFTRDYLGRLCDNANRKAKLISKKPNLAPVDNRSKYVYFIDYKFIFYYICKLINFPPKINGRILKRLKLFFPIALEENITLNKIFGSFIIGLARINPSFTINDALKLRKEDRYYTNFILACIVYMESQLIKDFPLVMEVINQENYVKK